MFAVGTIRWSASGTGAVSGPYTQAAIPSFMIAHGPRMPCGIEMLPRPTHYLFQTWEVNLEVHDVPGVAEQPGDDISENS